MSSEKFQLFKSQLRGEIEGDLFRSFIVFNEGIYSDESRKPIGNLQQFSEYYLFQSRVLELEKADTTILLLPIENELVVNWSNNSTDLAPEQAMLFSATDPVSVSNKFPDEISRFYLLRINSSFLGSKLHTFDSNFRNQLQTLIEQPDISMKIGIFDGRKEAELESQNKPDYFIFSINGAFEVQNRLLETNDGLFISHSGKIELEALSEHAVILILEF